MAVADYPHPVQRAPRVDGEGIAHPVNHEFVRTRTQDCELFWHDAGQFHWGRTEAWRAKLLIHGHARADPLERRRVIDIDSEAHRAHAEWLLDRRSRPSTP